MKIRTDFDPLHNIDQMADLIGEVTGEPAAIVIDRLEQERLHPGRTVAEDFARHGGPRYLWGKHLEEFYNSTNAFIYELVIWNRNYLKAQMRRWTTRHMATQKRPLRVLSVGDGLGFDCLHLAHKKHDVTYFELAGVSERFARALFARSGLAIDMLTDPAAVPSEKFDAITCFDVLEHVPDPLAMVKTLASWLKPGGLLYVSAPFYMILPWYPTHLRANRRFSGSLELYAQAGLRLVGGQFTWYPIVVQKAGGDTAGRSHSASPLVRLSGLVQKAGRMFAWPFLPIHLLRRINNRKLGK
ncbi:MAG TPA: class I SAM-dependent methyltransferase [Tepidisphaeraceae bacterium]|nr:class I SAM-dependent methyltransferase [Tepidisphaeraceae bacterium]